jgi:hypothetical protein
MEGESSHRFRAGDLLQDLCRVCKTVRNHTVVVADSNGAALRVICDYCGSQHNFRGGESKHGTGKDGRPSLTAVPLVTERERTLQAAQTTLPGSDDMDLEMLLRRIIREETGLTPVPIADKWNGGEMILKPGKPDLQSKSWPIETFFHKVVMLRNRLRVLEQQINAADIPEDMKIRLQGYITGCYGTLTSFNILFSEEEDRFHGMADKD